MAKTFGVFAGTARGAACMMLPMMADAGALRLSRALGGLRGTLAFDIPPEQQAELDFLSDNPEAARGGTVCTRAGDMRDVRNTGNLGSLPLIVVAAPGGYTEAGPEEPQDLKSGTGIGMRLCSRGWQLSPRADA